MQENWIGKSQGLKFRFQLSEPVGGATDFEVFTTRPDTIFGASFAAISPDHPIATVLAGKNEALDAFLKDCKAGGPTAAALETAEKKGFDTGASVIHPFSAEEHTSELQSLMRRSYAVICLNKKHNHSKLTH